LRSDNRNPGELRKIVLQAGINQYAEGSVLICSGSTRVHCTASVDEKVPPFLRGSGSGWVTAEYDMLPRATKERNQRERGRLGGNGRSLEIQRLIGRSLRSVCSLVQLGERTIILDCDVLQADGGTRTAAITGSWLAMMIAMNHLVKERRLRQIPVRAQAAAISVGLVDNKVLLDLSYEEDSRAQVDLNVVMTDTREIIEIQGSGERSTFSRVQMDSMLDLAEEGLTEIFSRQMEMLRDLQVGWQSASPASI